MDRKLPSLPLEILLRILGFSLGSDYPIIDPLSKRKPENLTLEEKNRGNELAIGFLATSRVFHVEGTRALWANNTFIFTSHEALRNFSNLAFDIRKNIKHVNLRIIAKYFDDCQREFRIPRSYHPNLKRDVPTKVHPRVESGNLVRNGFRSYSWAQTVDFLNALRPPYDPNHDKKTPRPRLLPGLDSMRIDFINFPENFLPVPGELHQVASHQLGYTLNELCVTGLPCCDVGVKAGFDLGGMLKDDGLFLDGSPVFVQTKTQLRPLDNRSFCAKVVRPWKKLIALEAVEGADNLFRDRHPTCPEETGHPESAYLSRPTLWKRVPLSLGSSEREWIEFDRKVGFPADEAINLLGDSDEEFDDSDDEEMTGAFMCAKCGQVHLFAHPGFL
jgi:hypothetical protein